jgi:hypothetical protein
MSGGSYQYLFERVTAEYGGDLPYPNDSHALEMLDDLAADGFGESRIANDLRRYLVAVEALHALGREMSPTLRAIEWEKSGDIFEMREAIAAYEAAK